MMVKSIISGSAVFLLAVCSVPAIRAEDVAKTLRVQVAKDVMEAGFGCNEQCRLYALSGEKLLFSGKIPDGLISPVGGGINVCGRDFNVDSLLILCQDGDIRINKRYYRGQIRVDNRGGRLNILNNIGIEEYVKGVLFHEASPYWPMAMLKAQSVVVRTYALYISIQNRDKDYDLTADVYSQVYGGSTFERRRPNKAVDETNSLVLKFNGSIIPAFFHATCAGHTEAAKELWKIDIEPLKGVVCPYCRMSPYYNWARRIPLSRIQNKLNDNGIPVREITGIRALDTTSSGRLRALSVSDKFHEHNIAAKDFRIFVGPDEIRSTNFTVALERGYASFEGLGWGHGVGLCQWGGYFMAKGGKSFRQILEYYYPGAIIAAGND